MITVLVLDDHDLMRRGIVDTIEQAHDLQVVAEAASARQALARARATRPDIAVLDLRLPDGDGPAVCRGILSASPSTRCLILSSIDDDLARAAAAAAGASAFVLKSARAAELIEAVRAVAAGRTISATLRPRHPAAEEDAVVLTPRERQLLALLAEGLGNRQIAQRLGIAEKTVKNYLTGLLRKLGVTSRTQAALYEVRRSVH